MLSFPRVAITGADIDDNWIYSTEASHSSVC